MKAHIFSGAIIAGVLVGFSGQASYAAKGYKCNAQTSFGAMNLTFKNNRVRGGSFALQNQVLSDGSIRLSYQGEYAILGNDGLVRGRDGAVTGPHKCDLTQARAQLK